MSFSTHFTHAITRRPAASIIKGLRAVDTGTPDLALMQSHHDAYIATLRETGATVVELPALETFPDSVFVEDTALCLPQGAVVMRPGAPSRLGEAAEMAPHLRALYGQVVAISGPDSFIEGGDILVTETEILVGRSARTNANGVAELITPLQMLYLDPEPKLNLLTFTHNSQPTTHNSQPKQLSSK